MKAVNVGYGNMVAINKVATIIAYDSSPVRQMVTLMRDDNKCVDATRGHKTKSVVFLDNGWLILSAVTVDTLAKRFWDDLSEAEYDPE